MVILQKSYNTYTSLQQTAPFSRVLSLMHCPNPQLALACFLLGISVKS